MDIDTTAVRMVQLRRENGVYAVTGAYSTEIAPWGDDPELRRIHTVRAIQKGLSKRSIDGKLAVCGVRGPEVVVRSFEFPLLLAEEIGSAVGLEASQICPFSPDQSAFDYQVTSVDDGKTRGFWVAANNGLIRSIRQVVRDAGLHCVLLDVAGLALLNCLHHWGMGADGSPNNEDVRDGSAIVDVGGSCTTIAIRDRAGRPFVRDLNSGSDQICRWMADETQIPFETARAAMLNYGAPQDRDERSDAETGDLPLVDPASFRDNVEEACAPLVEDIVTTLRYYATQHGAGLASQLAGSGGFGVKIERVLVCGALSRLDRFIDLLAGKLHLDVQAWNPVETMRCDDAKAGQRAASAQAFGPSMSLAAGLAMRNL
ncbi:MAG TPA: pilus assembly protein PilM [Sedimentisphaerales bacterium]|nr:pilus assembly protein PilM [Sedimentisphaerales bacterium]